MQRRDQKGIMATISFLGRGLHKQFPDSAALFIDFALAKVLSVEISFRIYHHYGSVNETRDARRCARVSWYFLLFILSYGVLEPTAPDVVAL